MDVDGGALAPAAGGAEQPPAAGDGAQQEERADPLALLPPEMRQPPEGEGYPDIQVSAAPGLGRCWRTGERQPEGACCSERRKGTRSNSCMPVSFQGNPPHSKQTPMPAAAGAHRALAVPAADAGALHQRGDSEEQVRGIWRVF